MADAHRRGPSRLDRETRRRLSARRRRAVQRAVRCRPGVGMDRLRSTAGEHDRVAGRVVLGKRRVWPIVVAPVLVEEVAARCELSSSCSGSASGRTRPATAPPTAPRSAASRRWTRASSSETPSRGGRRTGPCGPCREPEACPRPRSGNRASAAPSSSPMTSITRHNGTSAVPSAGGCLMRRRASRTSRSCRHGDETHSPASSPAPARLPAYASAPTHRARTTAVAPSVVVAIRAP